MNVQRIMLGAQDAAGPMGQGYRGLELAALPEYTPPLPRAGPGANVSHEVAMILIDGKQTARDIRAELKAQVEAAV